MTSHPEASRNPNAEVVRRAIAGLTAMDLTAVLACLADEAIVELPFERDVPPLDKSGMATFLGWLFGLYRQFDIELTHLYDLIDPDVVIARYVGDCIGREDDVGYANEYIAVFEFEGGLISSWREYDNPMVSRASQRAHAAAAAERAAGG